MRRPSCVLFVAALAHIGHATNQPIRNIYTFPNNTFIENIATSPRSGHLLATSMSVPYLYSLDPSTPATTPPRIVHVFPNATGLSGIAPLSPSPATFGLVTGIWDLPTTRAQPGSLAIWTAHLTPPPSSQPTIKLVTAIPNSTILNGLATHPTNPHLLLAADSALGAVWRIDLRTGEHGIAFASPLLLPVGAAPGTNLGVNGLKTAGRAGSGGKGAWVYFTNSAKGLFGRAAVDYEGRLVVMGGGKGGVMAVLARSEDAGADVVYDDFAVDEEEGVAWVAAHPRYVVRVDLESGGQRVVANDSAKLLNPTSAALGVTGSVKGKKTLYVTNGGEFVGTDLVNEGVVAVDLW